MSDQKPALYEIVDRRKDVSILLRQFISGGAPEQTTVLDLMERYGELDGEIIYRYATAFTQVDHTLSDPQQAQLLALRTNLLGSLSLPSEAYLFATPIAVPEIPDSDFCWRPQHTPREQPAQPINRSITQDEKMTLKNGKGSSMYKKLLISIFLLALLLASACSSAPISGPDMAALAPAKATEQITSQTPARNHPI